MRTTMAYYRRVGSVPPQRHTRHRRPDGGPYPEEPMGEEGLAAGCSLPYRRGVLSAVVDAGPGHAGPHPGRGPSR
ncbi:hypothetical protein [Allostreptomyces psammosilenae]|uniref:Uncharacterized protein n=1 Tax=Allostreptomyces psammosilenae TaxID=1892865 RepID=A0A853A194_9ACTN|nr:hypothetical protein [Allostreptomyces psammosilenae]NYI04178.1 hypothetical protein [Allostreptomyces psammosilenae]